MVTEHPKLRDDLIITQLNEADDAAFVIKDPVTNRYFRFKKAECFIAAHLDGKTSLADIQDEFEREFGLALRRERLERYIERLQKLCLLESGLTDREISSSQREILHDRDRGRRLLYIKLKTIDPNKIFDAVVPHIGFFFTRRFVWLAIGLTLLAVGIIVSNWGEYIGQTKGLLGAGVIPTFLLVAFTVSALHELAHGLTCKRFGGNVHELGFILIYFLPAFYCNVSDAWLFQERWKRLWVSFAGVFFQAFVWGVAVVVWRVVDPETWLSSVCCVAMGTAGLSTVFNLTPLLKLDGYYLLADYLQVPNLRKRSFDYLVSNLKTWVWPVPRRALQATKREKRIYWTYGVSAGVYSIGVLGFVFAKIAGFVFSEFHGTGLVLLAGAVVVVSTNRLDRWAKRVGRVLKGERFNVRTKRAIGLLCGFVAAVLIVVFGKWELKVSSKSELLPSSRASVRAEVDGTIREIYVREGDTVDENGLVARLDDTEYRAGMRETEAEIAVRTAELELLQKGPLDEEITRATKVIERARTKVEFAEKEYERIRALHEQSLVAPTQFEGANENLKVCRKDLEQAESELQVLLKRNRPETITAAGAEIARLRAAYEFLEEQVARTEIVTPIAGTVATHHMEDKVGEYLEIGDEVCQIVSCRTLLLEMPVSEKDVTCVRVGQPVKFRARSIPKIAFRGRVASVAPVANKNTDRTVVIVTSEVDNPDLILRPGMTGNAKIYCGKKRLIYLWTWKIIRFIRVEFWW